MQGEKQDRRGKIGRAIFSSGKKQEKNLKADLYPAPGCGMLNPVTEGKQSIIYIFEEREPSAVSGRQDIQNEKQNNRFFL